MSLSLALSCSIQALPLGSEYLDTVLPKTEAFLRDHAHLLRLLRIARLHTRTRTHHTTPPE